MNLPHSCARLLQPFVTVIVHANESKLHAKVAHLMERTKSPPEADYRDIERMRTAITGEFTGWSNAVEVTQEMIDDFARLSGDTYWIHTDPERAAKESPFGTTIAHGMLVQSLVGRLNLQLPLEVIGHRSMVNYGSDKLRFPTPVPAGSRIHARSRVKQIRATAF